MSPPRRLQFTIDIAASPSRVYAVMLDQHGFRDWASAFAEGSYFEGSWRAGDRIRFLTPSGDGLVAEIAENRPHDVVSIRHLGQIVRGVEDTDSASVRAWAPAYENYTFLATAQGTRLVVDQDASADFEPFLRHTWPLALQRLKALCEAQADA